MKTDVFDWDGKTAELLEVETLGQAIQRDRDKVAATTAQLFDSLNNEQLRLSVEVFSLTKKFELLKCESGARRLQILAQDKTIELLSSRVDKLIDALGLARPAEEEKENAK